MKEGPYPVKAQSVPTVTKIEGLRQASSTQKGFLFTFLLPSVTQRLFWQQQTNYQASCISWHSISRAM